MDHSFNCLNVSVFRPFPLFVLLLGSMIITSPEEAHCLDTNGIVDCSGRGVLNSGELNENLPLNFSCFLCCHLENCCERNATLKMQLLSNRIKFLGFCSFLLSLKEHTGHYTNSTSNSSSGSSSPSFIGFNGSNNEITEIPCFVQWSVLHWVDLSNNKISRIVRRLYFGKDTLLRTLILKNNFIHVILPYVFSRLFHLKYVFLNGNPCIDDWSFLKDSSNLILVDYRGTNTSSCLDSSLCGSCINGTEVVVSKMKITEYQSACSRNKTSCSFITETPAGIPALTVQFPMDVCGDKNGGLSCSLTIDNKLTTVTPEITKPPFTGETKEWIVILFISIFISLPLFILARCCMKRKGRFRTYGQFYSQQISIEHLHMDELCTETYYSTIPEKSNHGKIFSDKEMNLIVCFKSGPLYNRWMGTVTCNYGNICVFSSTVTENARNSQIVHWDDYVRKSVNLPRHQNLTNAEGICLTHESIYLVQEYLNCETIFVRLQHCLNESPSFTTLTTFEVIKHLIGILDGLELLHSFGFLHPGLTTKKVLLTNKGICKLYDFCLEEDAGNITEIKKSQMTRDLNHFAPEALYGNVYTSASDVWSTAVVFWEVLSGHSAFRTDEQAVTDDDLARPWPEQYKVIRNDHLFDCWQLDCSLRPSVQGLRSSFLEISDSVLKEITAAASQDSTKGYIPMNGSTGPLHDWQN